MIVSIFNVDENCQIKNKTTALKRLIYNIFSKDFESFIVILYFWLEI